MLGDEGKSEGKSGYGLDGEGHDVDAMLDTRLLSLCNCSRSCPTSSDVTLDCFDGACLYSHCLLQAPDGSVVPLYLDLPLIDAVKLLFPENSLLPHGEYSSGI